MASTTPGGALGSADAIGNIYGTDAFATAISNATVQTNFQKKGRTQAETISGG